MPENPTAETAPAKMVTAIETEETRVRESVTAKDGISKRPNNSKTVGTMTGNPHMELKQGRTTHQTLSLLILGARVCKV